MSGSRRPPKYVYKKLKANKDTGTVPIRLLRLYPNLNVENTLLGQIVERGEKEAYEALSYCWHAKAECKESSDIYLFEEKGFSSLELTPNLAAALRRLRKDNDTRSLWIDAICINQADDEEKSEQIPHMSRIYKEAEKVCIWLGEEAENEKDDEIALAHMQRIIELQGFELLIDSEYTTQWAALASLMKREWFSRRWVVQEIAYAREAQVYWGKQEIDWKDLADAVALFGSKADKIAELFRQDRKYSNRGDFLGDVEALGANRLVHTIGKVFRKADNGQRIETLLSLEALISNLSAFNSSRPHDIIYAVLSLAKDARSTAVKPSDPWPLPLDPVLSPPSLAEARTPRSRRSSIPPRFPSGGSSVPNIGLVLNNALPEELQEPTSPIHPSANAFMFESAPDREDKEESIIELLLKDNFDRDEIRDEFQDAKARIKVHLSAMGNDLKYETMIEKLKSRNPNAAVIGRAFWDEESISWSQESQEPLKGMYALTWKLLRYERVLKKKAFMFLQNRRNAKTFHVDYKKKFYEVCRDFVDFTIKSSKSLDMLCRPWAPDNDELPDPDREPSGLPSWICPLSKSPFQPRPDGNFGRVNADLLVGMPDSTGGTYTASAATEPTTWFFGGVNNRNLFVTGLVLDEIVASETEAVEGNIPHSWLRMCGWNDTKNTPPPESFWRTIVADRNERGQNPPSYYQRACKYAFGQRTSRGSLNTDRLINNNISQVMTEYIKRVQAVVWMRKLIRTQYGDSDSDPSQSPNIQVNGTTTKAPSKHEVGRLGLAPASAEIGDKICLLRGCSVPVVLREIDDSELLDKDPATEKKLEEMRNKSVGNKWRTLKCKLIGECYIHGIMDGEAFKIRVDRNLPDYTFEIQ